MDKMQVDPVCDLTETESESDPDVGPATGSPAKKLCPLPKTDAGPATDSPTKKLRKPQTCRLCGQLRRGHTCTVVKEVMAQDAEEMAQKKKEKEEKEEKEEKKREKKQKKQKKLKMEMGLIFYRWRELLKKKKKMGLIFYRWSELSQSRCRDANRAAAKMAAAMLAHLLLNTPAVLTVCSGAQSPDNYWQWDWLPNMHKYAYNTPDVFRQARRQGIYRVWDFPPLSDGFLMLDSVREQAATVTVLQAAVRRRQTLQ